MVGFVLILNLPFAEVLVVWLVLGWAYMKQELFSLLFLQNHEVENRHNVDETGCCATCLRVKVHWNTFRHERFMVCTRIIVSDSSISKDFTLVHESDIFLVSTSQIPGCKNQSFHHIVVIRLQV
jgi:hypothetical protein